MDIPTKIVLSYQFWIQFLLLNNKDLSPRLHTFHTQPPTNSTTATMAPNGTSAASFYAEDKNLMKLCDFLRSSDGPAVREAIEMDKRVYYIKGTCY